MSSLSLASLAMHRLQEMESRLNAFYEKCDRAVENVQKLKLRAQSFTDQLNCNPSELKDKFLSCMRQLDEFNYILTEFELALDNSAIADPCTFNSTSYEYPRKLATPLIPISDFHLMDSRIEPIPSTSKASYYSCPVEKPIKKKIPKEDQLLISFSSSSSTVSVQNHDVRGTNDQKEKILQKTSKSPESMSSEVDQVIVNVSRQINKINLTETVDVSFPPTKEAILHTQEMNLPAQTLLQADCTYKATIMYIDGLTFWAVVDTDMNDLHVMLNELHAYYTKCNSLTSADLMSMTYCAMYSKDDDLFFRALIIKKAENEVNALVLFLVDVGEIVNAHISTICPLAPKFFDKPPFARCCHFAGVAELEGHDRPLDAFLKRYIHCTCQIHVEDNSSESLSCQVILETGGLLSDLLVNEGLVQPLEIHKEKQIAKVEPVVQCDDDEPEYDDPLLAVAGYHNRDEKDICKHYKGGPNKTCFKGPRCKKRHVVMHPDGWTLDRVPVVAKYETLPLPAPGEYLRVCPVCVVHYNTFFVHFPESIAKAEPLTQFGVVYPPTTFYGLVRAMNSPSTRSAYKPLKLAPAPGELVAAVYPPDNQYYRAMVVSCTKPDKNVEVLFFDYGNLMSVREDTVRELEPLFWHLPAQAVKCTLAGIATKTDDSRHWAGIKEVLTKMILDKVLQARVVARGYDEITVELYDEKGFGIAEQLAATLPMCVRLNPYSIEYDNDVTHKVVVP